MKNSKYRYCLYILMALVVFLPVSSSRADYDQYWHLDEYIRAYPQEGILMDRFSSLVRSEHIRLSTKQAKPLEVLIIYPGLQVSDYWRRSVSSFEGRLKDIGIDYELSFHFTKPGDDEFKAQSRLIETALESDPDFLVFTLDAMRHKGLISRVIGHGKTKVILQNITTPIKFFDRSQLFLYVGFDHEIGTKMLADEYKKRFPDGARYAMFYAEPGYISKMRGDTFLQEMSAHNNMDLVASYYVPFDKDRAYKAAMELLSEHDDIDFIYASSTDMAHGIIRALKETGHLDDIVTNGWGGGESELEAIQAGELDFTVMRMNDDNGVAMAEALRLYLEGKEYQVPTVFSGDFRIVDRTTPAAQIAKWKDYAFRYSK